MKIFIVCSKIDGGGAERVAVLLANGFSQRGHETILVTNKKNKVEEYDINPLIKILPLFKKQSNTIHKWVNATLNIRQYVKTYKPDVIIGIMSLCTLAAKMACLGNKTPIVMTEHFAFERPASYPFTLKNKFFKFGLNKLYDHITVLTEADKKAIGTRLKNVTVMPNPLSLKPAQGIDNKENVVLAVGRLDGWFVKGFDILIQAWGQIAKLYPEWKLQIAGTGNNKNSNFLHNLVNQYGISNQVEFLGFCKDMQQLYAKSSIFVLSSRCEGFGLVLIEAMSQGCACIACDYKGRQSEIITNREEGLVCQPENSEELANRISEMIKNETYRNSIRENAIKRSLFYSLDNTIIRWENYLNNIIK